MFIERLLRAILKDNRTRGARRDAAGVRLRISTATDGELDAMAEEYAAIFGLTHEEAMARLRRQRERLRLPEQAARTRSLLGRR